MTDLLVIGAGIAGVSAALWGRSLGMSVRVLEQAETSGGQLHLIHFEPLNYAGAIPGDGPRIARRLDESLRASGAEVVAGVSATRLDPGAPAVETGDGVWHLARSVLVATGVRRRRLDVPGMGALEGRGISYSATQDRRRFAGEDVVVVGGGDAAFENALLLAGVGCRVTLAFRGVARARREFRDRVAADRRIEVLERTELREVIGDTVVEAVVLEGPRGRFTLPARGVVVKIGFEPNTGWCRGALDLDPEGYVRVDGGGATSREGVWAAGDVTRPPLAGLAVAAGQGALTVAAIRRWLQPAG